MRSTFAVFLGLLFIQIVLSQERHNHTSSEEIHSHITNGKLEGQIRTDNETTSAMNQTSDGSSEELTTPPFCDPKNPAVDAKKCSELCLHDQDHTNKPYCTTSSVEVKPVTTTEATTTTKVPYTTKMPVANVTDSFRTSNGCQHLPYLTISLSTIATFVILK